MPPRPRFNAGGWAAIGIAVAGPVAMTVAVLTLVMLIVAFFERLRRSRREVGWFAAPGVRCCRC
jgi:hypothetical protein